jgi:hypothetical protein
MPRIAEHSQHRDFKKARWTPEIDQLRSDVAKHLANKLAKKLNVSSVKVPWSKMKAGDVINWPSDLDFSPISNMSINEVGRLHKLTKDGLLDFSPEFLASFEIRHVNKWYHNQVDQLKSEVSRYLADKLANNLNVSNIRIPWSEMTGKDIINWPSDMDFIAVSKMKVDELKKLHKLTKDGLLDFTPEFLGRLKFGRLNRANNRDQLRSDVAKYLANKLAKELNVSSVKVPWSKIKAGDIINWPSDLNVNRTRLLSTVALKRLHLLVEQDLLDFSPEFLRHTQRQLAESKANKLNGRYYQGNRKISFRKT